MHQNKPIINRPTCVTVTTSEELNSSLRPTSRLGSIGCHTQKQASHHRSQNLPTPIVSEGSQLHQMLIKQPSIHALDPGCSRSADRNTNQCSPDRTAGFTTCPYTVANDRSDTDGCGCVWAEFPPFPLTVIRRHSHPSPGARNGSDLVSSIAR